MRMKRFVPAAFAALILLLSVPMLNAHPAAEILRRFTAFQGGKATLRAYAADTVRQAVQMALQLAQNLSEQTNRSASASKPVPPLVFIGGSAFVVAEALPLFR